MNFQIASLTSSLFFRNILNGNNTQSTEYKLNNVPVKLFPWEEKTPYEDKSFRVVQKSEYAIY